MSLSICPSTNQLEGNFACMSDEQYFIKTMGPYDSVDLALKIGLFLNMLLLVRMGKATATTWSLNSHFFSPNYDPLSQPRSSNVNLPSIEWPSPRRPFSIYVTFPTLTLLIWPLTFFLMFDVFVFLFTDSKTFQFDHRQKRPTSRSGQRTQPRRGNSQTELNTRLSQ